METQEHNNKIVFACPGCGKKYQIGKKNVGQQMKCRQCAKVVTIPARSHTFVDDAIQFTSSEQLAEDIQAQYQAAMDHPLLRQYAAANGGLSAEAAASMASKGRAKGDASEDASTAFDHSMETATVNKPETFGSRVAAAAASEFEKKPLFKIRAAAPPPEPKQSKRTLIIAGSLTGLAVIALGAYFFMG